MAGRRPIYTKHARNRMAQRGIEERDVLAALEDPAPIDMRSEGKVERRSRAGRFPLYVVFLEKEAHVVIITVARWEP